MGLQYAPGLIGYGTKGTDGTPGLIGLSTFFCEFDGTLDINTIKSKIVNNFILFSGSTQISGYPTRVYQTGDQFIDKNGKLFIIDLTTNNKYTDTGQQLNSSGFFEIGNTTAVTPTYTRYSNAYSSTKLLIDVVYSSDIPGNYSANPPVANGIYGSGGNGIGAVDFGQIKFVDNSINSFHPFTVYTNSTVITEPEKSFAIVKEVDSNKWHIGNRDAVGTIRDIDLYLDFKNVYIDGSLQSTFSITNLQIPGWGNINGDTSLNDIWANNLTIKENIITSALNVKNSGYLSLPATDISTDGEIFGGAEGIDVGFLRLSAGGRNDERYKAAIDIQGYSPNISNSGLIRFIANEEQMRITSSGYVGIGLSDPKSKLSVNGDVSVAGNLQIKGGSYLQIGNSTDTTAHFKVSQVLKNSYIDYKDTLFLTGNNPNSIIACNSSGHFIIGSPTTAPVKMYNSSTNGITFAYGAYGSSNVELLKVEPSTVGTHLRFLGQQNAVISVMDSLVAHTPYNLTIKGSNNDLAFGNGGNIYIEPGHGDSHDGNVYISTAGINGGSIILNTNGSAFDGSINILGGSFSVGSSRIAFPNITRSDANRFVTFELATGRLYYSVGTVSDERLKTIIAPVENTLNKILDLEPFYYKLNDFAIKTVLKTEKNPTQIGLSAQKLENHFPELIRNVKGEDGENYKGINYEILSVILLQSIKEQQNIINNQQKQINELFEIVNTFKK